ncbi:hypothetical protein IM40_02625 [Candidatus Paracaedimonas acanthamoebae]|nr:hypothetical protein IM40_02625 [Candidatus Paracaedimonas acanthamoebae]
MTSHMAACLEEPDNQNRRNGKSKTLWDRLSLRRQEIAKVAFPQIVKKRQTVLNASLDNKILGLYGLGMSDLATKI